MNKPTISVIVPAYNVELYILKCIDSILLSTFKDIEVIAIDDGSADNTLEILKSIKDTRFSFISLQTRSGLSIARNTGIDKASGKYISFVDADDWVSPCMLERFVNTVETLDADIVFCNHYLVYKDKTINACDIKEDLQFAEKARIDQYIHMFMIKGMKEYEPYFPMGQVWGTLYNASLIKNNNLRFTEGMQYKEDVIFNLYAAHHSRNIIRLNEPLYYYNKCNLGSLTASELKGEMPRRIEKDIFERRQFLQECRQGDEVFKAAYYQYVFRCFYTNMASSCVTDSSYAKYKLFYESELCTEAIQNIRVNDLKPKEKIIYLLLKYRGLPFYYFSVMVYQKIRRR